MPYSPDDYNRIELNLTAKNYVVERFDAVALAFSDAGYIPPLPWSTPSLNKSLSFRSN